MTVIDAIADWFQLNSPGIVVSLGFLVVFLAVIIYHVNLENNRPE